MGYLLTYRVLYRYIIIQIAAARKGKCAENEILRTNAKLVSGLISIISG